MIPAMTALTTPPPTGSRSCLHPAAIATLMRTAAARVRPEAAGDLARPLAQFRRRHAARRPSARSCRTAFDLGITHFDLANNYGPPPGSAEDGLRRDPAHRFRRLSRRADHLDQGRLRMWPGPYGEWGSRKYLLASLDQSLKRMGLDYVDIFYSHRFDPDTPLEETMRALDHAVRSGQALYVGISSYNSAAHARGGGDPARPRHALPHPPAELFDDQPLGRGGRAARHAGRARHRLDRLLAAGAGHADRQISRAAFPRAAAPRRASRCGPSFLNEQTIANIRALNAIAERRGQTLAQMALAWVLRGGRVTIGADRRQPARAGRGLRRRARRTSSSPPPNSPRSTATPTRPNINLWARSAERKGRRRNRAINGFGHVDATRRRRRP